jgi:hypothetical protein
VGVDVGEHTILKVVFGDCAAYFNSGKCLDHFMRFSSFSQD